MQIPTWRLRRDDWDIEGLPEPRRLPATFGHLQMIRQGKLIFLRLLQRIIIFAVRPYVVRELPGWGYVYSALVGDYRRNWLWATASKQRIRGKLHGYLMHLDPSRWSDRVAFFLGRWYALDIQLFLADVVRPGETVVDVGANRGMFALAASHLVGTTGRIICFEPNPQCVEILEQEIVENEITNIIVHRCGLADRSGEMKLVVPKINFGEGTFGRSSYNSQSVQDFWVSVNRGDDLLRKERPSVIKLDVEGYEVKALRGLRETLIRCNPIIITEVVPLHLEACSSSIKELVELLEDLNYRAFKLSLEKRQLKYDWILSTSIADSIGTDWVWFHQPVEARYASLVGARSIES